MEFTYFLLFCFSVCVVALSLALYLLLQCSVHNISQRHILISLCTVELLFSIVQIQTIVLKKYGVSHSPLHSKIEMFVRLVVAFQYILTMHHIAIDRLLEVYLHLAYSSLVTRRVVLIVVLTCWSISIAFAVFVIVLNATWLNQREVLTFAFYFFFAADVTFLLNASVTYTFLYVTFRRLQRTARRNSLSGSFKQRKFVIPFLLIISYITFDTTASFLSMAVHFVGTSNPSLMRNIGLFLYCCGILSDAGIYILLQRNVRQTCWKQMKNAQRCLKKWIILEDDGQSGAFCCCCCCCGSSRHGVPPSKTEIGLRNSSQFKLSSVVTKLSDETETCGTTAAFTPDHFTPTILQLSQQTCESESAGCVNETDANEASGCVNEAFTHDYVIPAIIITSHKSEAGTILHRLNIPCDSYEEQVYSKNRGKKISTEDNRKQMENLNSARTLCAIVSHRDYPRKGCLEEPLNNVEHIAPSARKISEL